VVQDSPEFASSLLDKAMEVGYNHPLGPLKLSDLVGLDVRLAIAEYLWSRRLNRVRCTAPKPLTGL